MVHTPNEVQGLVEERDALRKQGRYKESDALRERLEGMGYTVIDDEERTKILKKEVPDNSPKNSFLVLFGSGETSATGAKIHNDVFEKIGKDEISIAIVSTPAGFQPNVKTVYEEIAEFFIQHLANFHPRVEIVYANTQEDAQKPELAKFLDTADYIFTGPGSPTYAVKHLKNSLLYQKIVERVKAGATLSLASAATIAFSKFALPVYEIYKAGFPLYWERGLNFYKEVFQELTIVPHFNNREGGEKTDTSHCFVGKERFEKLSEKLLQARCVWGIDEHTAVIVDLKTKQYISRGKGKLWEIG